MSYCLTDSIRTYGFRFQDDSLPVPIQLVSIGHEQRFDPGYNWHGLRRSEDACLFQYTLGGFGEIKFGGGTQPLRKGQGFFVRLPSDHHYYLPAYSDGWEFYWIMVEGELANRIARQIGEQYGVVHSIDPESRVIKMLANGYDLARAEHIRDGFQASMLAYEFTLELLRSVKGLRSRTDARAKKIQEAMAFVDQHYSEPISVDDIAARSSLSKYHFMHRFREQTGYTPVQYLTKVRIENAAHLLQLSDHTIDDIAHEVGYANGNYFCKIFRKYVGCSPGTFRKGDTIVSTSKLTIGI